MTATATATPGTAPVETPATPNTPEGIADLAERLFAEEPKDKAEAKPEATPEAKQEAEQETETPAEEVKAEDTRPEWQRTKHKVRVNGSEVEVDYDELAKGYSRTEDYKAKTARLADEKRQIEATTITERKRHADAANFFLQQAQILDPILAAGARMDWTKLAQEDPATYVAQRAVYDQRKLIVQQAERDYAAHKQQAEVKHVQDETSSLIEKWPEWADEKKRPELAKGIRDFLITEAGYEAEEADTLKDSRAIPIIRDAMAYRNWKKAQSEAAKKRVVEPGKTAKPGASREDRQEPSAKIKALQAKAKNSRDPNDAAELAEAIFGRG